MILSLRGVLFKKPNSQNSLLFEFAFVFIIVKAALTFVSERDLIFDLSCLQKRVAKKRFRKQIFEYWGGCAYCGKENPTTLDHVIPRAKGGATVKQNLIAACGDCNILKSSEDWCIWFRSQSFWTFEKEYKILKWVNQPEIDIQTELPIPWVCLPMPAAA